MTSTPPKEIHVPQVNVASIPKRLCITQTMVDDFLCDPVLAARVLFGLVFDAFQAAALRIEWWVPNVIDESGFGTGKSLRVWVLAQLRCMLMPEQSCCAYYQNFKTGQRIFWKNYEKPWAYHPLFRAQLGKFAMVEGEAAGKGSTRTGSCWIQHYKNGGEVDLPAPNWMQNAIGEAGVTYSWISIDEWTKVETMGKKTGASVTHNDAGQVSGGINQQILGRLRQGSFNQYHMLHRPHCIFSATAESEAHPSQHRVNQFRKQINAGNPNYAIISFCFKDASNLPSHTGKAFKDQIIDWGAITNLAAQLTKAHFGREALGLRRRNTDGWYSEADVAACHELGVLAGLQPEISRAD